MSFTPSRVAVERRSSVLILIVLVVLMGMMAYKSLPLESSPDIQIPILIITASYPGASAEDVEALVTYELENEFNGMDFLEEMTSDSIEGLSFIRLEFSLDFNIADAKDKVREAIDKVKPDLPSEVEDPVIREINLSEMPILIINVSGDQKLTALKDIAEKVKEKIEKIPGILEVKRAGGLEREIQVILDPDKLEYYNLDANAVIATISRENNTTPGGKVEIGQLNYMIRILGEIKAPKELENMVISAHNNQPVYIRDVADVVDGFEEMTTRSRLNGVESVSLTVSKKSGENLILISDEIKALVKEEQEKYKDQVKFTLLSDASKDVRQMVSDLENNVYSGLFFVIIVLIFILGGRPAMFVGSAIPLSMLISFVVLDWMGITLNTVVLFSLILALGMLVDNAIVVVENIYRYLEMGEQKMEAAIKGVSEVAYPVIASTITTLAAFLPLLFMPGIVGEFMCYLPKTLIITLTASLFVGLIFNPVMCAMFIKKKPGATSSSTSDIATGGALIQFYVRFLEMALDHRRIAVLLSCVLWVATIMIYFGGVFPKKGMEFFPGSEPTAAQIDIEAPSGTTLEYSGQLVQKIENRVAPHAIHMENLVANVGQSRGSGISTTATSNIAMSFPSWEHWKNLTPSEVLKNIRVALSDLSGVEIEVKRTEHGPPTGPPVNIEISGNDPKVLGELSSLVKKEIQSVPGLVNLKDDFEKSRAELQVKLDREKISRAGLSTAEVGNLIRAVFYGKKASTFREGQDNFDITVKFKDQEKRSVDALKRLKIKTPAGYQISLDDLADIYTSSSYGSIKHVDNKRVVTVSADAEGVPGPVVLKQARERLKKLNIPSGYDIRYTGEDKEMKKFQSYLGKSFIMAIFLIFLVLVTQFNSVLLPLVILSSVVLSLIGVFLGMIIHMSPFSVMMSGVGIISLAGVVVNNSIVLIDYIQNLRKEGMEMREAIIKAGVLRMRPVLLTAVTTILGLMPIALGMDINLYRDPMILFGSEGGAFWKPMALAVIYGLGVATILTLVIVPVVYYQIERIQIRFSKLAGKLKKAS